MACQLGFNWFQFAFPWSLMMASIFSCAYYIFLRNVYLELLPTLHWAVFLNCWVIKVTYSTNKSLIRCMTHRNFLLFGGLSFPFIDWCPLENWQVDSLPLCLLGSHRNNMCLKATFWRKKNKQYCHFRPLTKDKDHVS